MLKLASCAVKVRTMNDVAYSSAWWFWRSPLTNILSRSSCPQLFLATDLYFRHLSQLFDPPSPLETILSTVAPYDLSIPHHPSKTFCPDDSIPRSERSFLTILMVNRCPRIDFLHSIYGMKKNAQDNKPCVASDRKAVHDAGEQKCYLLNLTQYRALHCCSHASKT